MGAHKKWSMLTPDATDALSPRDLRTVDLDRYNAVIQMFKDGCTINAIKRATGVSKETLRTIMVREQVELSNQDLTSKLRRAGTAGLDLIAERLEDPEERKKVSVKEACVIAGICADKLDKVAESTKSTRPQVHLHFSDEEFAAMLIKLPTKNKDKEGSIEV